MERLQFTFYRSIYDAIRRIRNPKAKAMAYDAVCAYALDGTEPDLDSMPDAAAIAVISCKPNLDASRRKASSGSKGGSSKQITSKQQAKPKQAASEKENEIEIEKEVENECYIGDAPQVDAPEGKRSGKKFSAPTVEEVRQYCAEKGYSINPEQFVDYYSSNGWRVGKNPMKDWRAAVRTWERKENPNGTNSSHSEPDKKYGTWL